MALLLGRREGRDVIAAHTVLAHLGGDGKLELLFHEAAEEASYRMWLPTGLGDDVLDRDAGLPPKHLDDEILLALRRHYSPLGLGGRGLPSLAARFCDCRLAPAGHACRSLGGSGLLRLIDAEGEKPALGDE